MKTKIIKLKEENLKDQLGLASDLIKKGDLVAFPTETVYGLGANGLDEEAVKKIYKAKGRPSDNPLILHIGDFHQVDRLVKEVTPLARLVMEKFWPGPITILFRRSDLVPDIITAGLDTVAIRMPENYYAREFLRACQIPVAAPSANTSGRPSPTKASHVFEDMEGKIPLILDGGRTGIGLESTVIDLSSNDPILLRPGGVTLEEIKALIPGVKESYGLVKEDGFKPRSPGQKYKHYAPKAPLILIEGEREDFIAYVKGLAGSEKIGVMTFDDNLKVFSKDLVVRSLGPRGDFDEMARNLFDVLREFDQAGVSKIYGELVEGEGLVRSILNRMLKAADGNVISLKEN